MRRCKRSSPPGQMVKSSAGPAGMLLVLEPVIWEDGTGGYRSEEIVVITEDGYEILTSTEA